MKTRRRRDSNFSPKLGCEFMIKISKQNKKIENNHFFNVCFYDVTAIIACSFCLGAENTQPSSTWKSLRNNFSSLMPQSQVHVCFIRGIVQPNKAKNTKRLQKCIFQLPKTRFFLKGSNNNNPRPWRLNTINIKIYCINTLQKNSKLSWI